MTETNDIEVGKVPPTINKNCNIFLNELEKRIIRKHIHSEKYKYQNYIAARFIQKTFRGYICRKGLKLLQNMAIILQKYIRRFLAQKRYYEFLEKSLQYKLVKYYNDMAILIQKYYRGYLSRIRKYDYYDMKEWIRLVVRKNYDLQEETTMYFHKQRLLQLEYDNDCARHLCIYIASKIHHFLRTRQIAGIYSKQKSNTLSHIEHLLSSLRFKNFNTLQRQYYKSDKEKYQAELDNLYSKTINNSELRRHARCETHYRNRTIESVKPNEALPDRSFGTRFKQGLINYPYVRNLSSQEIYCDKIILLSREFDIIDHKKDFSLNTKIIEKPEKIHNFIDALQDFCLIHNLIEK